MSRLVRLVLAIAAAVGLALVALPDDSWAAVPPASQLQGAERGSPSATPHVPAQSAVHAVRVVPRRLPMPPSGPTPGTDSHRSARAASFQTDDAPTARWWAGDPVLPDRGPPSERQP